MATDTWDFIVIGAGSAGCVLADRLSADGRHTVLVLESGGHHDRFFVNMPLGYGRLFHDASLNWSYRTEPDASLDGRTDYWPRGRILGGSSSINAMVYIRGQREDFDDWARLGNTGWGYEDVLPYFRRSEGNELGASRWHGGEGPMKVSSITKAAHPVVNRAIEAGRTLGFPLNEDFNGASQEGFGLYQFTFRGGRRVSNAVAFLERAMRRPNVTVLTGADATRILFDGPRACGVEYRRGGVAQKALARAEVILSAGAIASPALLQHSGIGPAALLREHGIEVRQANEAVGANLQDHAQCGLAFETRVRTLNDTLRGYWGQFVAGLQYVLARRGPLTLSVNQGGAFVSTQGPGQRPDTQFYILPLSFQSNPAASETGLQPDAFSGMLLTASPCRPESRGSVRIRSRDPLAAPAIQANYLSTPGDMKVMTDSLKMLLRLAECEPLAGLIKKRVRPAAALATEAELQAHARANCKTTYHASCSCSMGSDPAVSVVDPQLRVHGVPGLRVVDASVMPLVVSGNTNATTTMIAEKGADLILADHP